MPFPVSSLSVAVQAIAVFLDSQFTEEVNIKGLTRTFIRRFVEL